MTVPDEICSGETFFVPFDQDMIRIYGKAEKCGQKKQKNFLKKAFFF